jgi:hypothetical protein
LALKKLRRLLGRSGEAPLLPDDHIDAPCMCAVEAQIPVGNHVAITPSFRPADENASIEEVPLGNVVVSGRQGRIFQRGFWLMRFSWYGGQTFLPPSYQIPPISIDNATRTEAVDGACTSTISPFAGVYGHALMDELPFLLWLLEEKRFEKYDTILCTTLALHLLERTKHRMSARLIERARPARDDTLYEVSAFTAIKRSGCRMNPSMEELQLLRSRLPATLAKEPMETPTRVYLARNSRQRTVENEHEIRSILNRFGFTSVSPTSLQNPWAVFAQAEIVIGVAGSDLADSVFMKPGAVLFEIYPSTHVKPYYFNVAGTLGLRYRAMIAQSQVHRPEVHNPANAPIWIDPAEFERRLEAIVIQSTSDQDQD